MTVRDEWVRAAAARGEATVQRSHRPRQRRCAEEPAARGVAPATVETRGKCTPKKRDGLDVVEVAGHASVYERAYEMWDMWGPYTEIVSAGAGADTLTRSPVVEFALNHGRNGAAPMASTRNSMLELSEDDIGLLYAAFVDPARGDVTDMILALERGDLAEASFKFSITSGQWSPDYTEFRINAYDLDRGDVSAVNFGANPAATSGVRAASRPDTSRMRALLDLAIAQ